MMNKKFVSILVAGALAVTMGTSAFAASARLPICTVSGCTTTGSHQHNGTSYAAHTASDGHTYHNNCGVAGCTQTGDHTNHNANHTGGTHRSHNSGGHHR